MLIAKLVARAAAVLIGLTLLTMLLIAAGPHAGAYRTHTITSNSMAPSFNSGDVVLMTPARPSSVRIGDVITFHAPTTDRPVVTHRIDRILERGTNPLVRTRGDANAAADPWDARLTGATVWRQQAVIPFLGTIQRAFTGDGFRRVGGYVVAALLLALIGGEIVGRRGPARARRARTVDGYHGIDLHGIDEQDWAWLDEPIGTAEWDQLIPLLGLEDYDAEREVPLGEHDHPSWSDGRRPREVKRIRRVIRQWGERAVPTP